MTVPPPGAAPASWHHQAADDRRPRGPPRLACLKGDYLAGRLPGRRRIRSAPSTRAPRNTTMPITNRYNRPFATTPTMPSTIATITNSKNRAIIRPSAQSRSAAGQPPLPAAPRLVGQAIVLKDRLFIARRQLAVGADRRGVLHQLPAVADLHIPRAHGRLAKRHEHQPVPGRHPDPDRAKRRQVGAGVHVDSLQLTDLVTLGVHHVMAAPFPDVGSLEHASLPPTATLRLCYDRTPDAASHSHTGCPRETHQGRWHHDRDG